MGRTLRQTPTDQRRSHRRSAAFTLLEVMIAIGILAFGMLGIAAMQINAMNQSRTGKQTTEAATIAHTVLESFNRLPYGLGGGVLAPTGGWTAAVQVGPAVIPGILPGWVPTQGTVQVNGVQTQSQIYSVQWQISDAPMPAPPPFWNPANGPARKFIDVRVTWNELNFQNRQVIVSGIRYDDQPSNLD